MQRRVSVLWLLLAAVAGAGFVWMSGQALPPLVASHFGPGGMANGFMPRSTYVNAAMIACLVLPIAIVLPVSAVLNGPNARINLPHRDYWLSAEQRPETVQFIRKQLIQFGIALLVFICYVHWLVVRANELRPPHLAGGPFVSALAVFIGFVVVSIALFFHRFGHPPR